MDLQAYVQIEDFEEIAKENNIVVPRLRGYRLMKDEEPLSSEEIKKLMKDFEVNICSDLCCSNPFWNADPNHYEIDSRNDRLRDYYLIKSIDEYGSTIYTDIRWDRIHGWKRKILKFEIKKIRRKIQKQYDVWNKYAGKENILYIHARIGGGNWSCYGGDELVTMPWFLDKVDDFCDETYCDIYALIK